VTCNDVFGLRTHQEPAKWFSYFKGDAIAFCISVMDLGKPEHRSVFKFFTSEGKTSFDVLDLWSVTLCEHRFVMFENRALRIFGPKMEDVA